MASASATMRMALEGVIQLMPAVPVPREELEAATLHVQDVLDEHTNDITNGASASANFARGCIEIDLVVEGESIGELHQRIAVVIGRLEQYCEIPIGSGTQTAPLPQHLGLRPVASQTSLVAV